MGCEPNPEDARYDASSLSSTGGRISHFPTIWANNGRCPWESSGKPGVGVYLHPAGVYLLYGKDTDCGRGSPTIPGVCVCVAANGARSWSWETTIDAGLWGVVGLG